MLRSKLFWLPLLFLSFATLSLLIHSRFYWIGGNYLDPLILAVILFFLFIISMKRRYIIADQTDRFLFLCTFFLFGVAGFWFGLRGMDNAFNMNLKIGGKVLIQPDIHEGFERIMLIPILFFLVMLIKYKRFHDEFWRWIGIAGIILFVMFIAGVLFTYPVLIYRYIGLIYVFMLTCLIIAVGVLAKREFNFES